MQEWYDLNIKKHCQGLAGFEKRIKSAFLQAKNDGVTHLVLSFGIGDSVFYDYNLEVFIKQIKNMKEEIYPNLNFYPEISFQRGEDTQVIKSYIDDLFAFNFFKSIDLVVNDYHSLVDFKII